MKIKPNYHKEDNEVCLQILGIGKNKEHFLLSEKYFKLTEQKKTEFYITFCNYTYVWRESDEAFYCLTLEHKI